MNWDVTDTEKYKADGSFKSTPLTIVGIEGTKMTFSQNNVQKGYIVRVEENITYWKDRYEEEKINKKFFTILSNTYVNNKNPSLRNNSAFYYLAHHFRKKSGVEIPFVGYWISCVTKDEEIYSFCLSQEANKIIEEEKRRWDSSGLTKEEDLRFENIELVDAKWGALEKDINGDNWNPVLNDEEKKNWLMKPKSQGKSNKPKDKSFSNEVKNKVTVK